MPGCSVSRLETSRLRLGSSCRLWKPMVVPTAAFNVCKFAPVASTTTDSVTEPILNLALTVSCRPMLTSCCANFASVKPVFSTWMSYIPGLTLTKTYRPTSLVVVVFVVPVVWSTNDTVAPTTGASVWSVIRPTTVPVDVDCPARLVGVRRQIAQQKRKEKTTHFIFEETGIRFLLDGKNRTHPGFHGAHRAIWCLFTSYLGVCQDKSLHKSNLNLI